jgi:hypothetical protein
MDDTKDQGEVIVEVGGSPVLGKYAVSSGTITVTTIHGPKSAAVGDLPPTVQARLIVRELARIAKG